MPEVTADQMRWLKLAAGRGVLHLSPESPDNNIALAVKDALNVSKGQPFVVMGPRETEPSFDDLWRSVVQSLEARWQRYFIKNDSGQYPSPSKWDLCPNTPRILDESPAWSIGEQVTMACLVSFYNNADGQQLLVQAGYENFVAALKRLDRDMLAKVVALTYAYQGW